MDAGLELRLLGPLEALAAGEPVAVAGRKPKALLGLLALQPGQVVSVDRLVEELWPGESAKTAPHAVKVYVSQLRKELGADAIATRGPGYALDLHPDRVDAHRFRSLLAEGRALLAAEEPARAGELLREALALWRGPALVDFAYEPFAQSPIAELEELRLAALEERIESDLALGLHGELVGELKVVVASNATRERVWVQLMLALYRAGRQADALAAYRAARTALVESLGIEPGPELRELEAAILRQDPGLSLEAAARAVPVRTRRRVTVLSVEAEVADGLDTEREHDAVERAAATVAALAARYGATAQRPGDGSIVAVFGTPVAHEDDPLRAARCVLETREAVAALAAELGVELELRAGVETGEIVAEGALAEGRPLRAAARLRQHAGPGEIVAGEEAAKTLADAALFDGDRLVELVPAASPFARTLDAPLVGRARELRALKAALRKAKAGGARAVLVTGTAGIGKSRLALELGRSRGVTTIVGTCPAYGEGLTYAPLRGLVESACGTRRDTILAALGDEPDAEATARALAAALGEEATPVPAAEVALAFRRLCEALARRRPLLVVVDDLHWAEPTFLELVEHLVDRAGEAPILVVGLAREELSEEQPAFLAERANAERLDLGALTRAETEALLDGLGGGALPVEQRARILDTAEGNPLYVGQLLALAAEGGLAGERPLPHTIESLLAARLDRLGPAERMVLGRAAVVGRGFAVEALTPLLAPEAVPALERHLEELVARGFLREDGEAAFRFRHVLVQEASYRATPKAERAELHERHADLLARAEAADELVGYHLEQAHRLRTEVGLADRRAERLAEDAGRRLGTAGVDALKRGDMHATVNLLGRATTLLPERDALRRELLCELAIALRTRGDAPAAEAALVEATALSEECGDPRIALRARLERAYLETIRTVDGAAARLLELAEEAETTFAAVGDHRLLGRAWLLAGFVHGAFHCQEMRRLDAAERALEHYVAAGWPTSTCLGEIAIALYDGPVHVDEAIERLEALLEHGTDRAGEANVLVFLGGLEAMRSDPSHGRGLMQAAQSAFEDLGHAASVRGYYAHVLFDAPVVRDAELEPLLRAACTDLLSVGDLAQLSTRAAELSALLAACGMLDEARVWLSTAASNEVRGDVLTQIALQQARSALATESGDLAAAVAFAAYGVELADETDHLNRQGAAIERYARTLDRAGRSREGRAALKSAVERYQRKGNQAAIGRISERSEARNGPAPPANRLAAVGTATARKRHER